MKRWAYWSYVLGSVLMSNALGLHIFPLSQESWRCMLFFIGLSLLAGAGVMYVEGEQIGRAHV